MYRNRNLDTIIAPATIPGTGAICILRISGPEAIAVCASVISPSVSEMAGYSARFFRIFSSGEGSLLDEVVVTVFRAPHSYTGEDSVEISCHSSRYIVSALIDLFIAAGCRSAEPGEFTRRAFLSGKIDLSQAEAVADVIASSSAASHQLAIRQLKGQISSDLSSVRAQLLHITSLLELELDFSEEDVEFTSRSALEELCAKACSHIKSLCETFSLGNALKEGFATAIVGAANAGKSTLLNALLGEERAIVSPIAGTTRDTIEESISIDGIVFRFIDTAGIRESSDQIEKIGIERSMDTLQKAQIVLCVLDSCNVAESREMVQKVLENTSAKQQSIYFIWNKIDLDCAFDEGLLLGMSGVSAIKISAKTQEGIDSLKKRLAEDIHARQKAEVEEVIISSRRHLEALQATLKALERVHNGLAASTPTDLVAEDLREAIYNLGTITGEITTPETLNNIFTNFCIGK